MKKLIFIFILLCGLAGLAEYARREWRVVGSSADGGIVEIPRGLGARGVVGLLEGKKVISNRYAALAYIFYTGTRNKLQAGEYVFDHPMTIPEVVGNAAVMVNPENLFEMMRALQHVLLDQTLREKLRCAGYEQVKKFSWDRSVSEVLAGYREVVS